MIPKRVNHSIERMRVTVYLGLHVLPSGGWLAPLMLGGRPLSRV
jgi:hypothetical protein